MFKRFLKFIGVLVEAKPLIIDGETPEEIGKLQNNIIYGDVPKPNHKPEEDEFESVDLNDIDPDELLSDKIFEMLVTTIPEGWFVFEAGQSPLHMLWFCQLIDFNSMCTTGYDDQDAIDAADVRRVYSEEKDTLTEALQECIRNIELEEFI